MSLVRVPDRMNEFNRWVRNVTKAAELKFDRRAKGMSKKSSSHKKRRRRSRRRHHGSRD